MRIVIGMMIVAAACGGGSHATPDATPADAPVDAPVDAPPPGPNLVTLEAPGPLALIAYRDGKGPWLVPAQAGTDTYALHVTNDYQWVIVCASGGSFDAEQQGATFADGAQQFAFCFTDSGAPSGVAVTGQMAQAGSVWMSDTDSSATPAWTYNLTVPTGMHELTAAGDNHLVIRRGLSITAATTEPAIDVDQEGTAMTAVPLTITGLGSDTLTTYVSLLLAHDAALLSGTSTTLEAPPASLLAQGDVELLELVADGTDQTERTALTSFTGSETSFTLMPKLAGVTFATSGGQLGATWQALPSYTALQLAVEATAGTAFVMQRVSATKGWLDATGATTLAFDPPTGYDAAWHIDLAGPYVRILTAANDSGSVTYDSSEIENVNGAARTTARRFRLRREAARAYHGACAAPPCSPLSPRFPERPAPRTSATSSTPS